MNSSKIKKIVLDPFCYRQFDKLKTKFVINYDREQLAERVNEFYLLNKESCLKEGYAPFCKHIFIENFTDSVPGYVEINEKTEILIKTIYEARNEKELPVLKRYVPVESIGIESIQPAKFLDIILYSKEQIQKENQAMGNEDPSKEIDYDYGIISIKPQNCDHELPMDPITMMRNALGVEEGGSGVSLERNKYIESVNFWSKNILLK